MLHAEHAFSDRFVSYMLSRTSDREDLIDQLFQFEREKRLARTLLLLAATGRNPAAKDASQSIAGDAGGNELAQRGRG